MSTPSAYFEQMYRLDDPWGYRDRWYEERKRQLLLAMLPWRRFDRVWDMGCSNGEFAAALLPRCNTLLATDLSARAVELTTERLCIQPNARVQQMSHPEQWPDGTFDLIVFGELGYFLDEAALIQCAVQFAASLERDGVLVACHWKTFFEPALMAGPRVHELLNDRLSLQSFMRYEDQDCIVEGWSRDGLSIAAREGLK